jgi:hypothetical protein
MYLHCVVSGFVMTLNVFSLCPHPGVECGGLTCPEHRYNRLGIYGILRTTRMPSLDHHSLNDKGRQRLPTSFIIRWFSDLDYILPPELHSGAHY